MLKLNDNNVEVGYIKQILNSFNLPTCRVYTDQMKKEDLVDDSHYIYNNDLCLYKDGELKKILSYKFNDEISGITKNLQIRNNKYDSYTHKYLGNYLRFLRDYKNIDLMSMYNCFTGEYPELLLSDNINDSDLIKTLRNKLSLDDDNYTTFMLPINTKQEYTIKVDSPTGAEVFAGIFENNSFLGDTNSISNLLKLSDVKLSNKPTLYTFINNYPWTENWVENINFTIIEKTEIGGVSVAEGEKDNFKIKLWWRRDNKGTPQHPRYAYIFEATITKLDEDYSVKSGRVSQDVTIVDNKIGDWTFNCDMLKYMPTVQLGGTFTMSVSWKKLYIPSQYENNVKLFIKVPISTKSIVVLEGNYLNTTEGVLTQQNKLNNITVQNLNACVNTNLQLLEQTSSETYLVADRLLEYLSNHAIYPLENIVMNIKRLEYVLKDQIPNLEYYGTWTNDIQVALKNIFGEEYLTYYSKLSDDASYEYLLNTLYGEKERSSNILDFVVNAKDVLGYYDKTMEKLVPLKNIEFRVN